MIWQTGIENIILKYVENANSGRHHERHGTVTSYDPMTHLAKVMLQPEGIETGFIPIEVRSSGNGFGTLYGPMTGSGQGGVGSGIGSGAGGGGPSGAGGQSGQMQQGDQVVVRFQEGEPESGKIVSWLHSKVDMPPTVQSGEYLYQDKHQHHLFFDKDGNIRLAFNQAATQQGFKPQGGQPPPSTNIGTFKFDKTGNQTADSNKQTQTVTDSNGATLVHDGQGNHSINAKKITHNSTAGDINHSASNNNGNANIVHTAQNNITHTATNGNYSRTANSGTITDTAPTINHNGTTDVTGPLNVSQLLSANGGFAGLGGGQISGLMKMLGGFQSSGGGSSMSGGATVTGGLSSDTVSSTGSMTAGGLLTANAGASVSGGLTANNATLTPVSVASLPAATTAGMRSHVTDSTVVAAGNFGNVVAGTGTHSVPVWSDGTNWRIG